MKKKAQKKKEKTSTNKTFSIPKTKKEGGEKLFSQKKEQLTKKFKKISTGVPGIDKISQNGFVEHSVNMVVGSTGTGKSIFSIEFLVDGLKKGEKCLYISFEEGKAEVYQNLLRVGIDLAAYEKKGDFFFLEYSPQKVKKMLEEGGGEIETIVITKKVSRMGIDSITSFASLSKDKSEERELILDLFSFLRKWKCTVLLTSEERPIADEKTQSIPEFESDSIINLYTVVDDNKRKKYLEIFKMRGSDHSKDFYEYDIGDKGIVIGDKADPKVRIA